MGRKGTQQTWSRVPSAFAQCPRWARCRQRANVIAGNSSRLLRTAEAPPIYQSMTRFLPILPLRDIVVFPHRIVPLFVGRDNPAAPLYPPTPPHKTLFLLPH